MKGHTDSSGKFHPHTSISGLTSSQLGLTRKIQDKIDKTEHARSMKQVTRLKEQINSLERKRDDQVMQFIVDEKDRRMEGMSEAERELIEDNTETDRYELKQKGYKV